MLELSIAIKMIMKEWMTDMGLIDLMNQPVAVVVQAIQGLKSIPRRLEAARRTVRLRRLSQAPEMSLRFGTELKLQTKIGNKSTLHGRPST